MRMLCVLSVLVGLLFACAIDARAGEPSGGDASLLVEAGPELPALAGEEAEETSAGPLWLEWLDVAIKTVGSALGLGLLWLLKRIFSDYQDRKVFADAMAALEEGWSVAQEEFVTWAKRAKADGKLAKEERAQARTIAWEHAKSAATGPAKDLLYAWGQDKVMSLLGRITAKSKATKAKAAG